ncbi:MAG: hypothetical protein P1U86_07190 [Verrucomicrobiales bacterium]|nr:hypothetical protein [Verrucomicrobiales bacterium]
MHSVSGRGDSRANPWWLLIIAAGLGAAVQGQEAPAKLGVVLDTSPEMGFLVPQARKEIRILNRRLQEAGQPLVKYTEVDGAGLDKEGSFSVGASRNNLYAMQKLFREKEVDTVYWITSMKGMQTPAGMGALTELLNEDEASDSRTLVIRNAWQEQLVAGADWVSFPPSADEDRLDPASRPGDWYEMLEATGGIVIRSWQTPPLNSQAQFGFPFRIRSSAIAKRMQIESSEVHFDISWAGRLEAKHGLNWMRSDEEWLPSISGRRWISDATLIPFFDSGSKKVRDAAVFEALSERPSIEADLQGIALEKLGVLFSFGFLEKDVLRFKEFDGKGLPRYVSGYMEDFERILHEVRQHNEAAAGSDRVYLNRMAELTSRNRPPGGTADPHIAGLAELITQHHPEAIYWFTNGYWGKGDYGKFGVDLEVLSEGILNSGVKLYIRIPFEFGVAPSALEELASRSGGAVLKGSHEDEGWSFEPVRD